MKEPLGNSKFKFNAFLWCSNLNLVAFHFPNEFELLELLATFIQKKKLKINLKIAKAQKIAKFHQILNLKKQVNENLKTRN